MTTLDEQDLRHQLNLAVAGMQAHPTLIANARRGAARRRAARRTVVASLSAVLMSAAAVGGRPAMAVFGSGGSVGQALNAAIHGRSLVGAAQPDPLGRFWRTTAEGDLANNSAFIAQAIQAWRDGQPGSGNASRGIFNELVGEPVVLWAGTTPAGPAAVVAQRAFLNDGPNLQLDYVGIHTLLGFVGSKSDGSAHLVTDTYQAPGVMDELGGLISKSPAVALVLDPGTPVGVSYDWTYGANFVRRDWKLLEFGDNVAVVNLGDSAGTARFAALPFAGSLYNVVIPSDGGSATTADSTLTLGGWAAQSPLGEVLMRVGSPSGWKTDENDAYEQAIQIHQPELSKQIHHAASAEVGTNWYIVGTLPNGRKLVVGEHGLDIDAEHVYAVISDSTGNTFLQTGVADPSQPLPIAIHLPDAQGWVLASYGDTLRWRVPGGTWSAPATSAVLTADAAALEVEVFHNGQTTHVFLPTKA